MADVLFVMLLVVLFALTAGVVKVCDRLVGADEELTTVATVDDNRTPRSAAHERRRPRRTGHRTACRSPNRAKRLRCNESRRSMRTVGSTRNPIRWP